LGLQRRFAQCLEFQRGLRPQPIVLAGVNPAGALCDAAARNRGNLGATA
jgi:hypothetical protein